MRNESKNKGGERKPHLEKELLVTTNVSPKIVTHHKELVLSISERVSNRRRRGEAHRDREKRKGRRKTKTNPGRVGGVLPVRAPILDIIHISNDKIIDAFERSTNFLLILRTSKYLKTPSFSNKVLQNKRENKKKGNGRLVTQAERKKRRRTKVFRTAYSSSSTIFLPGRGSITTAYFFESIEQLYPR
jgi:hypothetical protein